MGKGIYNKYEIRKRNGEPIDEDAVYFVLRLDTDPAARYAMWKYIEHESVGKTLKDDITFMLTGSWKRARKLLGG